MTKPPVGQAEGKREQVEAMFDEIAPRYDLLNRVLSFGTDVWWRKRAVAFLGEALPFRPRRLLDVATGTADLAVEALSLKPDEVVGVDISEGMLRLAAQKLAKRGLMDRIRLVQADAAALPFDDGSFDGALVGFGVRNFEDLRAGLAGIRRVLRPAAPLVVLEFGHPTAFPVKQAYEAYARHVLPRVGRAVSGSDEAYTYLPESVAAFPDGADFLRELEAVGFREAEAKPLTFGIVSLYRGRA
ncbi:MAG TPA: bifunctional demethylmenaquinone methyltransferase/2-methoxy-6-polyprenyl-1,4-benzoquinol methylase UbiE [Rubricoccaceae bacterium]|nr:bifunctional demethylmenaquinone methyltransferase/2-methoxy-6-polyprenyl-1,4-benzoquinol methylase UbiE [Rubricoccaceae bacterium]